MDSSSSVMEKEVGLGYESMIRVDGRPILPPLMSDARRQEMRQYREQALRREAERQRQRQRQTSLAEIPTPQLFQNYEPSPPPQVNEPSPVQVTEPSPQVGEPSPVQVNEPSPPLLNEPSSSSPHVEEPSPPQIKVKVPSPALLMMDTTKEDDSKYSKPTTPRGVRFFDDNSAGTPNVTIRPHRRRIRAPFFDDVTVEDSESVASDCQSENLTPPHTNRTTPPSIVPADEVDNSSQASFESGTSAISTNTFIIETSQSYSMHNNSFLSEGEVIDDSDDDDLDEAANLHVPKGSYSAPHQDFYIDTPREFINPALKVESLSSVSAAFKDDTMSTASAALKDDTMSTVSAAFTNTTSVGASSICDSFGSMGLSKLKSKIQTMSPSLFKIPGDTRSPLLKGVVFMDPLNRPRSIKELPPEASDPSMKPKFDRVTACIKGYLVRRLLKTEKVVNLLQTIHDTVELILNLYAEGEDGRGDEGSRGISVMAGDKGLHARLIQQLNGACGGIQDIFFKLSTPERMAIISTDRIKMRSRALREGAKKAASGGKKSISIATLRCMERRKTIAMHPPGPKRAKYQPDKLPLHVPSHIIPTPMPVTVGSQTVKSKQAKTFVVSPKRRRMTTFAKPSTPTPPRTSFSRGGTALSLSRLAQLDKNKSSSNPNVSKSRNLPTAGRTEGRSRKKMDSTFVKPKGTTRPLVSSNR